MSIYTVIGCPVQMVNVIGEPVNCDIACEEILKFLFTVRTGRLPE